MQGTGGYGQFSSERVEYINLTRFCFKLYNRYLPNNIYNNIYSLKIVSLIININSYLIVILKVPL